MTPTNVETLFLYVVTSEGAVSAVLVCQREKEQVAIYYHYHSKRLQGAETRYPHIEKIAFVVIHTARRLETYFLAHPIRVFTNYLLRKILHKPDMFVRLTKWVVGYLSKYNLDFIPYMTIKGQAIADFVT